MKGCEEMQFSETITSLQNPLVKELAALKNRKDRQMSGRYFIEGEKLVIEALLSGVSLEIILVSGEWSGSFGSVIAEHLQTIRIIAVSNEILVKLSDTKTPQGIAAVAALPKQQKGFSSSATDHKKVILLEHLQDPGNVGAIIRTADACGFDLVMLSEDSADPWQPKVLRATMGSIWHIHVQVVSDIALAVDNFKQQGFLTVAAHPRDGLLSWEAPFVMPLAVVIGNESSGVSEELLKRVDKTVMIPMPGKAESLNAAVAAGILMYEIMRNEQCENGTK